MKKLTLTLLVIAAIAFGARAQKFALIDMEYYSKNVPSYEMANEQLKQISLRWQKEDEKTKANEAQTMYKSFQADMVFLTDEQKNQTRTRNCCQGKRGHQSSATNISDHEGELYQKRQTLMEPIQNEVYTAVKKVSEERGYQCIFDRASSQNIIFASPRIDVSNEVLAKMGYAK